MKTAIIVTNPETYLIVLGLFVLFALVWITVDHYIFLPRRVNKIIAAIKKEQAQREQPNG
jgi:hypothetical protein